MKRGDIVFLIPDSSDIDLRSWTGDRPIPTGWTPHDRAWTPWPSGGPTEDAKPSRLVRAGSNSTEMISRRSHQSGARFREFWAAKKTQDKFFLPRNGISERYLMRGISPGLSF
jgi:hypothetical protein